MNYLIYLLVLILVPSLSAQTNLECGVDLLEGEAIKQRMFDNRQNIRTEQLDAIQQNRSTTWIPVTIRIVGDAAGNGYTSEPSVYAMFCDLNEDYGSQNIQFYLNSPIAYLNNQAIHDDAFSNAAKLAMKNNKVANTLNIYVGQSINNATASFYSGGSNDFVFMLNAQVSATTSTCSHEVGHFFTLAHTFYGWENSSYQALYGGNNAPTSINGKTVEKFARTGTGSNCYTAADGFCDTPADYYSTRENCPYYATGLVAKDPTGAIISPSDSNVMSYFAYGCRRHFTTEQRNAILSDVVSRGWTNFSAPNSIATNLDGTSFTPISPVMNETITASGGYVTLTWNPIPGATSYYLELYNTFFVNIPNINSPIKKLTVNGTSYNILASQLNLNSNYAWKVKPINQYYTCANQSSYFIFKYGQLTNLTELKENNETIALDIYPNPIQNSNELTVSIASKSSGEGILRLMTMDGRVLMNYPSHAIQEGLQQFQLNISDLAAGTYALALTTKDGVYYQKFLVL